MPDKEVQQQLFNPPNLLYHVTAEPNAELIKRKGFDPGFCFVNAPAEAERILEREAENEAGEEEEDFSAMFDVEEVSDADYAREIFNAILARHRPANYPSHDCGAVFFWSDKDEAITRLRIMTRNSPWPPQTLITVDASKVPCQCFQGDVTLTDELYDEIFNNLDMAAVCSGHEAPGDEDQAEVESFCSRLDEIAKKYYESMKPFDGTVDPDLEILCPCKIPSTAIVETR